MSNSDSTGYFDADPNYINSVFWITLAILTSFWLLGFFTALVNGTATPAQMQKRGVQHGMAWTQHAGFWELLLLLHPVLAWGTSKMWPIWNDRGALIAMCLMLGTLAGFVLQALVWSPKAKSPDAWSQDQRPTNVGIIHILHMGPEIGIMLMLLISGVRHEMPSTMFFGILAFVANHLFLGNHWPMKIFFPKFRPIDMTSPLEPPHAYLYIAVSAALMFTGFYLLSRV